MALNAKTAVSLFCAKRFRDENPKEGQLTATLSPPGGGDFGLEMDTLRVAMAAPVRRLQQKTQVFPLDVKASSRSRLTHSLEVASYARLITLLLVRRNKEALEPLREPLLQCVANAALLHDIGNPPFGHFGESVIRKWLSGIVNLPAVGNELNDGEKEDLKAFNGNAQSLRLAHSIQELNLSLGQYAAVIKIPFTVSELLRGKTPALSSVGVHKDFYSWSYENAGIYLSELPLIERIRQERGTQERHPLATIMEWADDLSYVLADMEDAYERGLIDRYDILHLCDKINSIPELKRLEKLLSHRTVADIFIHHPSDALAYLRDVLSNAFIEDVTRAASSDLERFLLTGEPQFLESDNAGFTVISLLKQYERAKIYSHREVESLELAGASYLRGLLGHYEKLLFDDIGTFQKELSGSGGDPWLRRLACRISRRHREAYFRACTGRLQSEMYARVRLIVDYISGMTDTYAEAEFKLISGAGSIIG